MFLPCRLPVYPVQKAAVCVPALSYFDEQVTVPGRRQIPVYKQEGHLFEALRSDFHTSGE